MNHNIVALKKIALFLCFLGPLFSAARADTVMTALAKAKEAEGFLSWLSSHEKDFATCSPQRKESRVVLCEGTSIELEELKKLFRMKPKEWIDFIRSKDLQVEIMCRNSGANLFQAWCDPKVNKTFFKEVTSLHGQFVPESKTILLQSDASIGSMAHEYLHSLQFANKNSVFGKVYKSERVRIQKELIASFDEIIAQVKLIEKKHQDPKQAEAEAKPFLMAALKVGDAMTRFSHWQKLIDERNLFLLYIHFGKELGVSPDDIALAQKNISFICKDESIRKLVSQKECEYQ
jgi:hypothetical protein